MSDKQENHPDPQNEESPSMQKKSIEIGGRRISIGALAAWIGIFALLALLAFGLLRNQEGPVTVGEVVPNFTLTTFEISGPPGVNRARKRPQIWRLPGGSTSRVAT